MAYSFVPYEPKSPLSPQASKLQWAVAFVALLLLIASSLMYSRALKAERDTAGAREEQSVLALQMTQLKGQMAAGEAVVQRARRIWTENQVRSDQLADLLGLVPDNVVLTRFEWEDDTITFAGYCPDPKYMQSALGLALSSRFSAEEITVSKPMEKGYMFTATFSRKQEVK